MEWVHRLGFFMGEGDLLDASTDHTRRAGFVITTGQTRDEAVARAEAVVSGVTFETEPE